MTLSAPWSCDADPETQKAWACVLLGVPPTANKREVERAYRNKAKSSHPVRAGGDDEYFERVKRAKEVLLRDKIDTPTATKNKARSSGRTTDKVRGRLRGSRERKRWKIGWR